MSIGYLVMSIDLHVCTANKVKSEAAYTHNAIQLVGKLTREEHHEQPAVPIQEPQLPC